MDIVFITDSKYLMPTLVAIRSIAIINEKDNISDEEYRIHCLCNELSKMEQNMISALSTDKIEIIIHDVNDIYSRIDMKNLNSFGVGNKRSALLKFEICNIFSDLDKIVYLDGDIIVKGDISYLGRIDLADDYVAAVYDHGNFCSNKIPTTINSGFYFNSGVMVLNLKKMRDDKVSSHLFELKRNHDDGFFMDQSVLNQGFEGRTKLISVKYNCQYTQVERNKYFKNLSLETMNCKYGEKYRTLDELLEDTRIIHYTTPCKPWKYRDVSAGQYWDEAYESLLSLFDEETEEYRRLLILPRKSLHNQLFFRLSKVKLLRFPLRGLLEVEQRGIVKTVKRSLRGSKSKK